MQPCFSMLMGRWEEGISKVRIDIAYVSNPNLPQMAKRCPLERELGTIEIKNYKRLFCGSRTGSYTTIEPCEGRHVPVLRWTVGQNDEPALDRYEGYPIFYEKHDGCNRQQAVGSLCLCYDGGRFVGYALSKICEYHGRGL